MRHDHPALGIVRAFMGREQIPNMVAGGYARDMAFGFVPRDHDLIVYGLTESNIRRNFLNTVELIMQLGLYVKDGCAEDSDYPVDRVYGVIQTTCGLDIIFWSEDYPSAQSVLDKFDYNINQFVYDPVRDSVEWMGNTYGTLVQLRESCVEPNRKLHMEELAKAAGWTVPEVVCPLLDPTPF